jgi:hypothetical protein
VKLKPKITPGVVGDVLLVVGFAVGVTGLWLVSPALALCIGASVLFGAGVLLTVLDARGGRRRTDKGPFDPDTVGKPQ